MGQALEMVAWLVMARRLGPGPNGVLVVSFLLARYAGLVVDWGGNLSGARDAAVAVDDDQVAAFVHHRRRLGLVGAALLAAGFLATGHSELWPMALAVAAVGFQVDWLALGRGDAGGAVAPWLVRGGVMLTGSVLVSELAAAVVVVAVAMVGAAVCSVLLTRPPSRHGNGRRPSAWPLVAVLAAQVYISVDTLVLAWMRGSDEAGIYGAVYRIPLAWTTIVGLVVAALVPAVATELKGSDASLSTVVRRSRRMGWVATAVVLASLVPLWLLFDPIFGTDYRDGRVPVIVLMLAVAAATASAPLGATVLATGRDRTYALVLCAGAVVNLVLNLVLVPRWGMVAAAATTFATEVAVLLAMMAILKRLAGEKVSTHARA